MSLYFHLYYMPFYYWFIYFSGMHLIAAERKYLTYPYPRGPNFKWFKKSFIKKFFEWFSVRMNDLECESFWPFHRVQFITFDSNLLKFQLFVIFVVVECCWYYHSDVRKRWLRSKNFTLTSPHIGSDRQNSFHCIKHDMRSRFQQQHQTKMWTKNKGSIVARRWRFTVLLLFKTLFNLAFSRSQPRTIKYF